MRLAAIDIGTNSVKLLVADADGAGQLSVVTEAADVTRLGAGVDKMGQLNTEAMSRTLETIARFAQEARGQGASTVLAAGTSALRDASNGAEFIVQARAQAGVDVEIITGEREAELAFAAIVSDPQLSIPKGYPLLVFDIGGGSTELITGTRAGRKTHESVQMGAVRVTERYLSTDPPSQEETDAARAAIQSALATFPASEAAPFVAGLGGTAVNVAAVLWAQSGSDGPDNMHGVVVMRGGVQEALQMFTRLPLVERRHIPGLEPARADVIVGGVLVLDELLAHFAADRFTVSVRGLRFGLLAEAARRPS